AATTVTFGDNAGDDKTGTVEDAQIYKRSGNEDFNYGGKTSFRVGDPAYTDRSRRTLIRFKDIASNLPADIVITSATMYLHCKAENSTNDHHVSTYRVLWDWVEGTLDGAPESGSSCWNYYQYTGFPWNTAGCSENSDVGEGEADRWETPEASTLITGTGWFAWNLTAAVQNWYSGDWSEYGIILISDDEDIFDSMKIFDSKESTTDGHRPRLAVTYEEVPVPYTAHSDPVNGVHRSSVVPDPDHPDRYKIGACEHCHDTFNSSTCGVNHRMLFAGEFTDQDSGLNYDYSVVRGGQSKDCPESIEEAFKFIKPFNRLPQINCELTEPIGSAHDLKNIRGYMKGKWGWGSVNAEVNPCATCHNPHKATKDYPCSLPSSHSNTWDIWGDGIGEKMVDYLGADEVYQPPYKIIPEGEDPEYERNAVTQPNYVDFCLECHQDQQESEQHGTFLRAIKWGVDGDKHGKKPSEITVNLLPIYKHSNKGKYVLCCTDCHEPHGSSNEYLLRTEVNGVVVQINGWF
ncbi:MAG: cytochrome c3 family protein, partial [Deltaproteobacteria bacterium]|nr:cytochrome c3 family protein [Deltaproteobacteria bacterium]